MIRAKLVSSIEKAEEKSGIPVAMGCLIDEIERLENLLFDLGCRIEPTLTPHEPDSNTIGSNELLAPCSKLQSRIIEGRLSVKRMQERVRFLLQNCEL